ncbi:GNAT family N-acetyltransferase [Mesobacillus zeae]|uniref:GNAT family N-acetyltransferase n=1 Tax=Mesobacillus zeae TaxID=1917180 RepID=A0A398B245_9BACI|nr:GNAT family N-acetyltransferase [Mesobacillus zeae]RID82020.1 GNAT family N-acetyltransferase [Mesobacillus zeae]
MKIIALSKENVNEYREIRLEALRNNPEAFSSSYEEEKEMPDDAFANRLGNEASITLAAKDESGLLGVVTLVREQKKKIAHRANIFAMYVTPEARGKGVGKALMKEIIERARKYEGIEQIYLSVMSENEPAKKLYASCGFQVYGNDRRALKIDGCYYDEDMMNLYLV